MCGAVCFSSMSCARTTGIPYDQVVLETQALLQDQPKSEMFDLRIGQTDQTTVFQFIDGPRSKSAYIFPLRVTAEVTSAEEGKDSFLKVKSYQQGLFYNRNRPETAEKWRSLIFKSFSLLLIP